MAGKLKDLQRTLKDKGYVQKTTKSNHQKWHNPTNNVTVTVPRHSNGEIGTGLYNKLMKAIK